LVKKSGSHLNTLIMGKYEQLWNSDLLILGHNLLHTIGHEDIGDLEEGIDWPGEDPVDVAGLD